MATIKDTIYPRFQSVITKKEMERVYCPSDEELSFARKNTRNQHQQLCLLIQIKCCQRLGFFTLISEVPCSVIKYIAKKVGLQAIPDQFLKSYDKSGAKQRHIKLVRSFLRISAFDEEARILVDKTTLKAAQTKTNIADIINVAIEMLIYKRYELPAFQTISEISSRSRSKVNNEYYDIIGGSLSQSLIKKLSKLLIQSGTQSSKTDWDLIRQDSESPTINNMKEMVARLKWLKRFSGGKEVFHDIPEKKIKQFTTEALALDAARINSLKEAKKFALLISAVKTKKATSNIPKKAATFFATLKPYTIGKVRQ